MMRQPRSCSVSVYHPGATHPAVVEHFRSVKKARRFIDQMDRAQPHYYWFDLRCHYPSGSD